MYDVTLLTAKVRLKLDLGLYIDHSICKCYIYGPESHPYDCLSCGGVLITYVLHTYIVKNLHHTVWLGQMIGMEHNRKRI